MDQGEGHHQLGDGSPAEKEHSAIDDNIVVGNTKGELLQEFKKGLCEWMQPIVEQLTSLEADVSECTALLRSGGAAEFTGGRDEKFKDLANRVEDLEANVGDLKKECDRQVTETSPPAACTKDSAQPAAMAENDSGSASTPEVVPAASPLPKSRSETAAVPSDENKDRQPIDEKDSGNGGTRKLVSSTSSLPKPGSDGAVVPSDAFTDHQSDCEPESDEDSSVAILVANFDGNMRGEAAESVWEQLTSVAEQVLGKEVLATVRHYDTYVDSITAAKEDLTKLAEKLKLGLAEGVSPDTEGKPKKRRVVGALMTSNTNRLAIFHSEQSNTLFPVVKTLREQTENDIIVVVTQDEGSRNQALHWRSPDVQQQMEMQHSGLDGKNGLVLSIKDTVSTSQARAVASFLFQQKWMLDHLVFKAPKDDPPIPSMKPALLPDAVPSERLLFRDVAEFFGELESELDAVQYPPSGHRQDTPGEGSHREQPGDEGSAHESPPTRGWLSWLQATLCFSCDSRPPPPLLLHYQLVVPNFQNNPELEQQVFVFKSLLLPAGGEGCVRISRADTPRTDIFSTQGEYHIAVVFQAADSFYHGQGRHCQELVEKFISAGYDHCFVAALFDKGYLSQSDKPASDYPTSSLLRSKYQPEEKNVTLISWFSLPSAAVGNAVFQVTKAILGPTYKEQMARVASHMGSDWHPCAGSGQSL